MFSINFGDIGRAILMAILAPIAVALLNVLGTVITAPGFDAFSVDWGMVFKNLTNVLIVASYSSFSGYLLKNLLTGANGNFLTNK